MATSFTEFKECGFWSRDAFLEEWLGQLAAECRKQTPLPPWLVAACEHWELQATGIFMGWVHANLDEFLIDPERVSLIISISENVMNMFPPEHHLNRTGDLFVRLLKGELRIDASRPLDYMVTHNSA
jgi:hypothetical protein